MNQPLCKGSKLDFVNFFGQIFSTDLDWKDLMATWEAFRMAMVGLLTPFTLSSSLSPFSCSVILSSSLSPFTCLASRMTSAKLFGPSLPTNHK